MPDEQVKLPDGRVANVTHGYLRGILDQFDRLWAAIIPCLGPQDVTISADLAQHKNNLLAKVLIDALDVAQPHHVELAAAGDIAHAQEAIAAATKDETIAAKAGI